MKLSTFALPVMIGLATVGAGCSGSDGEIAVDAAATPLTAEPNDALFTIRLVAARDDGYALEGLVVKVTPSGKEAITVSCTPSDANGNKKLDKDETVACAEGASNTFDASIAGTELAVELLAQIDGAEKRVGDATWTPAK